MKKCFLFLLILSSFCFAQEALLLDDFEDITDSKTSIDFGAGGGSQINVEISKDIVYSGKQALKVSFEAQEGGYMWVARGIDLDVKEAVWQINPQDISWQDYKGFSFYVYGSNSGANVVFDIKDSGNEMWRFIFKDDFSGWKKIICDFKDFFARTDWQPDSSDRNGELNFPIKSFQFEILPSAKGTLYFDCVELEHN